MKPKNPRLRLFHGAPADDGFMESAHSSSKLSSEQTGLLLDGFVAWLENPSRSLNSAGRTLAKKLEVDGDLALSAFRLYASIMRRAIRLRMSGDDLRRDLQELQLDTDIVERVVQEYSKHRELLAKRLLIGITMPAISDVVWRADLAVSGGDILDEVRPVVLLELHYFELDGHKSVVFELDRPSLEYLKGAVDEALEALPRVEEQQAMLQAGSGGKPKG